jgi:hypothetical protein
VSTLSVDDLVIRKKLSRQAGRGALIIRVPQQHVNGSMCAILAGSPWWMSRSSQPQLGHAKSSPSSIAEAPARSVPLASIGHTS